MLNWKFVRTSNKYDQLTGTEFFYQQGDRTIKGAEIYNYYEMIKYSVHIELKRTIALKSV